MAGNLRIKLVSQIETQAQQIGIFAIILIKAVEAGLFAEQRGVADKIEDQAQGLDQRIEAGKPAGHLLVAMRLLTLPNADRVDPENPIYLTMAGNEVFKVAVTELAHIVDETLAANNLERSALDWLVPHQANLRIISATAKKLGMSMDNVVVTLDRHGNTSAASVPCALDEAVRDGRIQRGQLILLEAFGGGFTWGSALVRF